MARYRIYRHVRTKANELFLWSSKHICKNDPTFGKGASHIERYLNWTAFAGWDLDYCAYDRNTSEWHFIWSMSNDRPIGREPFLDADRNPYLEAEWARRVETRLDRLVAQREDELFMQETYPGATTLHECAQQARTAGCAPSPRRFA